MRLRRLLGPGMTVQGATGGAAAAAVEITGLSADSRAVQPGWLFAALPGSGPMAARSSPTRSRGRRRGTCPGPTRRGRAACR